METMLIMGGGMAVLMAFCAFAVITVDRQKGQTGIGGLATA